MADTVGDGSVAPALDPDDDAGLTVRDAVRQLAEAHGHPGLADEEIDFLLQERTAFPMGGWDLVASQLVEIFDGGWPKSEDVTITLGAYTVDMLCTWRGTAWVQRLLNDDTRHAALFELTEAVPPQTSGPGGVDRHQTPGTGTWPLAIDSHDWSRPPGRYLKSWSEHVGASDEEMAEALKLPLDEYRALLVGTERITPELARTIELITDTFPANFWLRLERSYRAALIDLAERPHD